MEQEYITLGEARMLSKQETEIRYWNPKWEPLLAPQVNLSKLFEMYNNYCNVKRSGVGSELYNGDGTQIEDYKWKTYFASLEKEYFLPKMREIYNIVKKHVLENQ